MSREQIKHEISKTLDTLPDKALERLLHFLKDLGDQPESFLDEARLKQVLDEDKDLLFKLAQ